VKQIWPPIHQTAVLVAWHAQARLMHRVHAATARAALFCAMRDLLIVTITLPMAARHIPGMIPTTAGHVEMSAAASTMVPQHVLKGLVALHSVTKDMVIVTATLTMVARHIPMMIPKTAGDVEISAEATTVPQHVQLGYVVLSVTQDLLIVTTTLTMAARLKPMLIPTTAGHVEMFVSRGRPVMVDHAYEA